MNLSQVLLALTMSVCVATCANSQVESQTVTKVDPPAAAANPAAIKKGKIVFLRCRSCHTTNPGGVHLTGPNLNGLIGAIAGTKTGYAFSDALVNSKIVWNAETLDKWLLNPSEYIPKNRMVFAGLPSAENRAALIEYLRAETQ